MITKRPKHSPSRMMACSHVQGRSPASVDKSVAHRRTSAWGRGPGQRAAK